MFMTKLFSTTCTLWVLGMSSLFAAAQDAPLPDELVTAGALRQLDLSASAHPNPQEEQPDPLALAVQAMGQSHKIDPSKPSLLDLPDEMLLKIFDYADIKSLLRLSETCRRFNRLIDTQSLPKEWRITKSLSDGSFAVEVRLLNKQGKPCGLKLNNCPFEWKIGLPHPPPYVRSLSVSGVNLSPEQLSIIDTNPNLRELNLWNRTIDDEGATALAKALETNTALRELYLWRNDINAAGAKALADALKVNKTLTLLNLGRNAIHDDGATALATALQTNTTLTSLNLSENFIGAAGATALATALQTNRTFRKLDLRYNYIDDTAQAQLRALAASRPGLKIVL